eukprot:jgi/Mesvir1/24081/Mv10803-RA.1
MQVAPRMQRPQAPLLLLAGWLVLLLHGLLVLDHGPATCVLARHTAAKRLIAHMTTHRAMPIDTTHRAAAARVRRTPAGKHRVPTATHPSVDGHTVWSAVPLDSHHGGDILADTLRGGAGTNRQRVVRYRLGTAGTSGSQRPQSTNSSRARGMRARGPAPKKPAHCDPSPNSVRVVLMSSRLGNFPVGCVNASKCPHWGKDSTLSCCYVQGDPGNPPNASMCEDAVWYHVPDIHRRRISRPRPDVVLVAVSYESSGNYPLLKSRAFMSQFDIEQTYRVTAPMLPVHLPMLFDNGAWLHPEDATQAKGFFRPPLPTAEKLKAIVTVNSNCHTKNHREELVKRLMDGFEVHSYGSCLKNRNDTIPRHVPNTNIPLYSKYRFCVAMENSNTVDYVSEKVYEALNAGCVPLYLGAPNIQEFLPYEVSRMIVDRRRFATEGEYFAEIQRLMHDDEAYEEYMAWRKDAWAGKPFHPAFKKYLDLFAKDKPRCELCRYLAGHKYGDLEAKQRKALPSPPPSGLDGDNNTIPPPAPSGLDGDDPTVPPPAPTGLDGDNATVPPPAPSGLDGDDPTVPPPPPTGLDGDNATVPPPPPTVLDGDNATVPPPPPTGLDGDNATVPPPPPTGLDGDNATVPPPPPTGLDGDNATVPPPAPTGSDGDNATVPPPAPTGLDGNNATVPLPELGGLDGDNATVLSPPPSSPLSNVPAFNSIS